MIWCLYDMSMIWRCLYDMDMMWRCLCSEKKQNAGRNLLGSVAAGPRSGINQYGRPGFSERRFKEKSISGVFFLVQTLFTTVTKAQEDLYKTYFTERLTFLVQTLFTTVTKAQEDLYKTYFTEILTVLPALL